MPLRALRSLRSHVFFTSAKAFPPPLACDSRELRRGSPKRLRREGGARHQTTMYREAHRWYSDRVKRDMGVIVYGHWGQPMIMFPTSGGDEGEYERQSMIGAIADHIDGGRVKAFCVNINHGASFGNRGAHPLHRSWMQRMYDEYIRQEVIPFIRHHCQSHDVGVWSMG